LWQNGATMDVAREASVMFLLMVVFAFAIEGRVFMRAEYSNT